MNVMIWMLAGGAIGWIACSSLDWNVSRGLIVSAIIGIVGAFFGGNVLAPVFGAGLDENTGFSIFALVVAAATAIGSVKIADMVYERFQV